MGIIWIVVRALLAGRLFPAEAFRLARDTDLGTGHRRLRASLWMLVPCVATLPLAAEAATFYVSPTGHDADAGTQASPWKTISRGVRALNPGDTLVLREGTYDASLTNVPGGTSWEAPVTIRASEGETVVIKPRSGARVASFQRPSQKYIIVDGLILDGSHVHDVVKITGNASHIRIINGEIRKGKNQGVLTTKGSGFNEFINLKIYDNGVDNYTHGLYIGSSDNLIERCTIFNNQGFGVHVYNAKGQYAHRNIVRGNRVYNNGLTSGQGIILSKGTGNQAYNNLVYGNRSGGIRVDYGAVDAKVFHNSVYNNRAYGIRIGAAGTRTVVRNNIAYGNGQDYQNAGNGTTHQANLFGVNPRWVNAASADFRLQSDSPARNQGMALKDVLKDYDGRTRPQEDVPDIGAFEFMP